MLATGSTTCSCRTACASVLASFRRAMERQGHRVCRIEEKKGEGWLVSGWVGTGDKGKSVRETQERNSWSRAFFLFFLWVWSFTNNLHYFQHAAQKLQPPVFWPVYVSGRPREMSSHIFVRLARHEASPEARCRCRLGRSYLAAGWLAGWLAD